MDLRPTNLEGTSETLQSVWMAARLADPALDSRAPITFPLDPQLGAAAEQWRQELYLPEIAPRLQDALAMARGGRVKELGMLDVEFGRSLPEGLSAASRLAGHRLAESLEQHRAARAMKKFTRLVGDGAADGHLLSFFALRCAEFSIADRRAHSAYIFFGSVCVRIGCGAGCVIRFHGFQFGCATGGIFSASCCVIGHGI